MVNRLTYVLKLVLTVLLIDVVWGLITVIDAIANYPNSGALMLAPVLALLVMSGGSLVFWFLWGKELKGLTQWITKLVNGN